MRAGSAALWPALGCFVLAAMVACGGTEPGSEEPGAFGRDDDDDDSPRTSSGGNSSSSGSSSGGSSGGNTSSGGSSGAPAGGTLTAGDHQWSLEVAGQTRSIRVHVPAAIAERKLPVVIALHGNGDDAANFEATSGLRGQADTLGFVLLVPGGIARTIQVGGSSAPNVPWDAYNLYENNWDLQLMSALREAVQATGSVLDEKLSVYGFSQGGYMAYRTANALAGDFSCAAVMAAADPAGFPVAFARQIPISLQIGSNDYAINQARNTDQKLSAAAHPHEYEEIAGLGHALAPAPKRFGPLTYCLAQSL